MNSPEFLQDERLRINDITLIVSEYQHRPDRMCSEVLLSDTEREILGTVFWDDIDKHDLSISAGIRVKICGELIAHHYENVLRIDRLELEALTPATKLKFSSSHNTLCLNEHSTSDI
jgi:hypothetical protein